MALIQVQDAAFSYDGKHMIFQHLNLQAREGEILCIIGPNGCGKSTLIDCLLGLNKLNAGAIFINEKPVERLKPRELAEQMAYVPQGHRTTFAYTVLDVVTMGRTYASKTFSPPGKEQQDIARDALHQVGLAGFEEREYTRLSGGELQLVLIARAIAQQSKLLIMDEPTAHLDFTHELTVMEIITKLVKDRGLSIIMATHFLNQAYYLENAGADTRVALMNDGGLVLTGTPSQVLTGEILEQNFAIITEIVESGTGERKYILPLRNKRSL